MTIASITNKPTLPSTAKFFAFVVLISGLALLSCMVTNAQVSNETPVATFIDEVDDSYTDVLTSGVNLSGINMDQVWAARLERALVAETESKLEVETWMLDAGYFTTGETSEGPVELEDWMIE